MPKIAIKTVQGEKVYEAHQSSSEFANEEFKLNLNENKGELGEKKGGSIHKKRGLDVKMTDEAKKVRKLTKEKLRIFKGKQKG